MKIYNKLAVLTESETDKWIKADDPELKEIMKKAKRWDDYQNLYTSNNLTDPLAQTMKWKEKAEKWDAYQNSKCVMEVER